MGIYPETKYLSPLHPGVERLQPTWNDGPMIQVVSEPGLTRKRTLTPGPWVEERTNCFCCSCREFGGADPACRNHGWAATRPCEKHKMPGSPWDIDGDEYDGVMPVSVEKAREGNYA